MDNQLSIFDYAKPAYGDSLDEIVRAHAELQLEMCICLQKCCGMTPTRMFKSCHEYYVMCPVCRRKTKYHKKLYLAMQAWNRGEAANEETI